MGGKAGGGGREAAQNLLLTVPLQPFMD